MKISTFCLKVYGCMGGHLYNKILNNIYVSKTKNYSNRKSICLDIVSDQTDHVKLLLQKHSDLGLSVTFCIK